jgi:hypothetical protein
MGGRVADGWKRSATAGPSAHPPSGRSLRLKALVPYNWITTVPGTLRDRNGAQVFFAANGAVDPSENGIHLQSQREI